MISTSTTGRSASSSTSRSIRPSCHQSRRTNSLTTLTIVHFLFGASLFCLFRNDEPTDNENSDRYNAMFCENQPLSSTTTAIGMIHETMQSQTQNHPSLSMSFRQWTQSFHFQQPINTLSSLSYWITAYAILGHLHRREWQRPDSLETTSIDFTTNRTSNTPVNLMSSPQTDTLAILYAMLVFNIGLGSWAFHAVGNASSATWDVVAQLPFCAFLLSYGWMRYEYSHRYTRMQQSQSHSQPRWKFWGPFGALSIVLSTPRLIYDLDFAIPIAICIVGFLWIELRIIKTRPSAPRSLQSRGQCPTSLWKCRMSHPVAPLYAGLMLLGIGYVILLLTTTDGPLCNPQSPWQGHAFWHVLSALSMGCVYCYYVWEDPLGIDPADSRHALELVPSDDASRVFVSNV